MADLSIRKDFVDGVQEIFTTLFTDGVSDGINLYLLSDKTITNVYGETKYKVYKKPILLVAKSQLTPTQGEQDVEVIKESATFTIPLKSLQENNIGVTNTDLDNIRKGVIEFHGVFYTIDNISPKAYIEDVFLMYQLDCTEDKYVTSVLVEEEEDTEELPTEPSEEGEQIE